MPIHLPPLPYAVHALEPYISRQTVQSHYGRHHAGYVDRVNQLLVGHELRHAPLVEVVCWAHATGDTTLFAPAAQAWNHAFYWASLRPGQPSAVDRNLAVSIDRSFGSFKAMTEIMLEACVGLLGSGWVWLVANGETLNIVTTANADTPLVRGEVPLLTIDVWEHAYYLDYQNRRASYVQNLINHLLNWEFATSNLYASQAESLEFETPIAERPAADMRAVQEVQP